MSTRHAQQRRYSPAEAATALSIIVPCYGEGGRLRPFLQHLLQVAGEAEILVALHPADAAAAAAVADLPVRLLVCRQGGRAAQMNEAADMARGRFLWFLHVDTVLASAAPAALARLADQAEVAGGCFRRRFTGNSRWLAWSSRLADLRQSLLGISYGDQGQFVRTEIFHRLGGFPDWRYGEDVGLSLRLRRHRLRQRLCGPPIFSSARRFGRRTLRVSGMDALRLLRLLRRGAAGKEV